MELTDDALTDTTPDVETDEPMPFDDNYMHERNTEPRAPEPTESPPAEPAAESPETDVEAIDAEPVVILCRSVLKSLERGTDLAADARQSLMADALSGLLGEQTLNDIALGEIAQALHETDSEAYEAWTNNQFKRGLVLAITTSGISGRLASNILALFRPQFIREIGIDSGVEMTMLDIAIGSLYDYAQATMEVRRVTRSGEPRSVKIAAQHARTMASAQPMLKTFLTTVEKLRSKKQARNLSIQAAGDVAIQVNEAGAPEHARAKDDSVLVAEMPLRDVTMHEEPVSILEAA